MNNLQLGLPEPYALGFNIARSREQVSRRNTLFKHVHIGSIPPTPNEMMHNNDDTPYAHVELLRHARLLGNPISYMQEQNGALIQNIVPIKKTESQQISSSSKVELGLHTETAFHQYKPSFVLLLCLRGDTTAVTTYAYVDDIVQHLSDPVLSTLTRMWYTTGIDDSFRANGEPDVRLPCSILREEPGSGVVPKYVMTYDAALMEPTNDQACDALERLNDAIALCTQEITLETGDLLVINNETTIHGRRPFNAKYDGTDRWVQRVLVAKDLPPKAQYITHSGHIITTRFN